MGGQMETDTVCQQTRSAPFQIVRRFKNNEDQHLGDGDARMVEHRRKVYKLTDVWYSENIQVLQPLILYILSCGPWFMASVPFGHSVLSVHCCGRAAVSLNIISLDCGTMISTSATTR